MSRTFTSSQISSLNCHRDLGYNKWIYNGTSSSASAATSQNTQYTLYATGDATIGGRKYVSFPANHVLTSEERIKHNIW